MTNHIQSRAGWAWRERSLPHGGAADARKLVLTITLRRCFLPA